MRLKFIFIVLLNSVLWSQVPTVKVASFKSIDIGEHSIRALWVDGAHVWYGSNKGRVGYYDCYTDSHFTKQISEDASVEFRALAGNSSQVLALSAGSPAYLYAINKQTQEIQKVYTNLHKDIFFDGLKRINEGEFFAFGDPINNSFVLLTSPDNGQSWKENYNALKAHNGEAAFAASNSTLVAIDDNIYIFTGGAAANLYFSKNKGRSWECYHLPIIQGKHMTGVFSADFYDSQLGIAVGGDYENPANNNRNKILTTNGGKTWTLIADGTAFGYASCVKFMPNSGGKAILALDTKGLWYSSNFGASWTFILDASDLYVFDFLADNKICAAGKNKLMLVELH